MSRSQNFALLVIVALLGVFAYIFWQQNQERFATTINTSSPPRPNIPVSSSPGDYRVIFGEFVIKGKQPDGDSVRFKADNSSLWSKLKFAQRLKQSKDETVQLRFEGIDAPELHYGGSQQPFGRASRDKLLEWLGFRNVTYNNLTVTGSSPERTRGAILSAMVEKNGRPVAYVLGASEATGLHDGSSIAVDDTRLRLTLNAQSLEVGMSYFTVYSSMPNDQIATFRALSLKARNAKLGVWALDKTSDFTLEGENSINEHGQLILPKLFRRATDFLAAKRKGNALSFRTWLLDSQNTTNSQDGVLYELGRERRLSDLIEQSGARVRFKADTLDLVFKE